MPDLRLGNVFQLPSRRISRRWTRSGTNLVIVLGALCAQTNLFQREMKIKKMYLKSNTRQENFRTFEKRDILNRIKSDQLPAEKTSLRGMVLPVKSLCVLSCATPTVSGFTLLTNGASPSLLLREKINASEVAPQPPLDSNNTKIRHKIGVSNNIFVTMYIFLAETSKIAYLYEDVIFYMFI